MTFTSGLRFALPPSVAPVTRVFKADSSLSSTTMHVHDVVSGSVEAGWPTAAALGIGSLQSLRVSPDRTRVALVGASSPYLRVLDIASKSIESGWPTMSGVRRAVAWSPDGALIATSSDSGTLLEVIDVASQSIVSGWSAPGGGSYNLGSPTLRFSPDSSRLCVCYYGSSGVGFDVYDVASKTQEAGWPLVGPSGFNAMIGCDWSPDGVWLALLSGLTSATRKLHVIDVASLTEESGWPEYLSSSFSARGPRFSHDSARLAVCRIGGGGVDHLQVIDTASKTAESGWWVGDSSNAHVEWSEDGALFAVGESSAPSTMYVYDAATKAQLWIATSATMGTDIDFA